MELNEFYGAILESLGYVIGDDGTVKSEHPTGLEPFTISDKVLTLPTKEFLANPDWNRYMAFHPLSENIARKDSEVFRTLQKMTMLAVNVDISILMSTLISMCADKDGHKHMNHKQTAFLSLFPDADETSLKTWNKIENKNSENNCFVKIYTLRNKKLLGKDYSRVTYVKFPFYDECIENTSDKRKEYSIFGVKIKRKKDAIGFKNLFEFIIKHADNPDEHYSFGTRSIVAPSFHSLMSSLLNVKTELQRTYRLLKMESPDLAWGKMLEDLGRYKGQVPPLSGNEGDLTEGDKRRNELNVTTNTQGATMNQPVVYTPPVAPTTPQVQQPVQQPTPQANVSAVQTVKVGNREVPVRTQAPMYQQQQVQQPVVYQQPVQVTQPNTVNPVPQQVQQMQPVYQQPTPQMQPVYQPQYQQPVVYQQPVQQPVQQMYAPRAGYLPGVSGPMQSVPVPNVPNYQVTNPYLQPGYYAPMAPTMYYPR